MLFVTYIFLLMRASSNDSHTQQEVSLDVSMPY